MVGSQTALELAGAAAIGAPVPNACFRPPQKRTC
jgi:hypothetical protein